MDTNCQQCGSPLKEGDKFCPHCGASVGAEVPSGELEAKPARSKKLLIATLLVVVLLAGLSSYLRVLLREFHPVIEQQPEVVVEFNYGVEQKIPSTKIAAHIDQGAIVIPLKLIRDAKLVRFFDPDSIQTFPMIAYITPEGKVVTAMSLSENCRSTDFYLQGHNIHCAACPSYWNMSSLEAYACCQQFFPDPIPSTLVNNEVRIDTSVVRNWRSRI